MSKTVVSDVIKKLNKEVDEIHKELEPMQALYRRRDLLEDAIDKLIEAEEEKEEI